MPIGPLLVVGLEMGLETLEVGVHSIPGMKAGFLITACGEIDQIILKKTSGRGISLIGLPHRIGTTGLAEGNISSMIGKGMTDGRHLPHRCHHLIVADGQMMLEREADHQSGVVDILPRISVGICTWIEGETIGVVWCVTVLAARTSLGMESECVCRIGS